MPDLTRATRKITAALFLGWSFTSAARILAFTVGSIAVVHLAGGDTRWTGAPNTASLIGSAVIAYPLGRLMGRYGRRPGLALGYVLGALGTTASMLAIISESMFLLLFGFFLIGLSAGANNLGRYAAGEANPPERRARAISTVVLGGTVGSIVGPSLVRVSKQAASGIAIPELASPFITGTLLFVVAIIIMVVFLRPDPLELARQFASNEPDEKKQNGTGRSFSALLRDPRARQAVAAIVFSQLTMVTVMTITPAYMDAHDHAIERVSVVIMAHTLGMYGLSLVTGWLTDRLGRQSMILIGGLILILACVLAPLDTSVWWLALALFLLGLGWNFGFVAGSTLLTDILEPHEQGRIQGTADMLTNVVSGVSSLGSGLLFSAIGFGTTSLASIAPAAIPILFVILLRASKVPTAEEFAS